MAQSGYTARHLTVLEGLEAVRKRPGMYIGSTDSRGLMHCLWEIIDNSVDEALAGHGNLITIKLLEDFSIEVSDEGRGVPIDIEPKSGLTGVELVYTKLHAGGKFGGAGYANSGGLHGVGASVVNALSARLDVEVDRDGKTWQMSFRHGEPGVFSGKNPDATFTPFKEASTLKVIGKVARGKTGTRVRYWADPQIFLKTATILLEDVISRARQTAFLVPGLEIVIVDQRGLTAGEEIQTHHFKYEGGIAEFVNFLAPDEAITETWRVQGNRTFLETVPVIDEKSGHMELQEVERICEVDIAMRWGTGFETKVSSFVNIIATPKGGTHLTGFEQGLSRFFRKKIEEQARKLKAGSDRPDRDDIFAGLTAVVTVRLPEPQFEGQTKEVLGTAAVRSIVSKELTSALESRFISKRKEDKTNTQNLLEKIVSEMKARISLRAQRDNQRRKSTLENSSLPAKLIDCRSKSVAGTELFIVEGDSALGTAKPARDSEFQALLPIRGKILNVQKASLADMLSNAECSAIIKVIGAGSGRDFDVDQARYGKVIIMSDADVDGAHIRTLLLTLFFRYMRPLIDTGRVFAAVPPLHRVIIQHGGRKKNETVYTYSEAELDKLLAELRKKGKKYVEPIQRYKGLGEMDADQLAETTMDKEHRLLRRVQLGDAEQASKVFELLMGNEVAPRKKFIVENSSELDKERIDA